MTQESEHVHRIMQKVLADFSIENRSPDAPQIRAWLWDGYVTSKIATGPNNQLVMTTDEKGNSIPLRHADAPRDHVENKTKIAQILNSEKMATQLYYTFLLSIISPETAIGNGMIFA